jgi:hypothetical protein
MRVLVPLGWLKLEVDPTKVLAHAFVRRRRRRECVLEGKESTCYGSLFHIYIHIYLTQMDKEIHCKKGEKCRYSFSLYNSHPKLGSKK